MERDPIMPNMELPRDVIDAIEQGRKVVAIKLLREATGLGLANAKVIVDRAAHRLGKVEPKTPPLAEESNTRRLLGMTGLALVAFLVYRFFVAA